MTDAEFGDFELEVEYRLPNGGNSGVFLRAWPEGQASGADFHEIQLLDDTDPKYSNIPDHQRTGALWNELAASPVLRPAPNQWHRLSIVVVGDQLKVSINGQQVVDGRHPIGKRERGRIGQQAHQTQVDFRNIRIKENPKESNESAIGSSTTVAPDLQTWPDVDVSWSTAKPYDFDSTRSGNLTQVVYTHGVAPSRELWTRRLKRGLRKLSWAI